jgi:hypothetical protein
MANDKSKTAIQEPFKIILNIFLPLADPQRLITVLFSNKRTKLKRRKGIIKKKE